MRSEKMCGMESGITIVSNNGTGVSPIESQHISIFAAYSQPGCRHGRHLLNMRYGLLLLEYMEVQFLGIVYFSL